jgi:putative transposase
MFEDQNYATEDAGSYNCANSGSLLSGTGPYGYALRDCRYLLQDRDTKFTRPGRAILASGKVEPLALPARSPNLNTYAERWVRWVKEEGLSKVILFGERSLRRALNDYVEHFHAERKHQGKGNVPLVPRTTGRHREGPVRCHERLGGLLRYYHQDAA